MKKLLLVLFVAVIVAGCTKKPAVVIENADEVMVATGNVVVDAEEDDVMEVVVVTGADADDSMVSGAVATGAVIVTGEVMTGN